MEFKDFVKNRAIVFLLIQAGITLSIGIIGCVSPPRTGISPLGFFMPFVYAFFCVLLSFITYSPRELSVKQMILKKVIDFLLLIFVVLLISYFVEALINTFMCVAIIISATVISIAVSLIDYFILRVNAEAMTKKLQSTRKSASNEK